MSIRTLIGLSGRLLVSAVIAVPVYWVNGVLLISPTWNIFLLLAIGVSALPAGFWQRLGWLPPIGWRALLLASAAILPLLLTPDTTRQHDQTAALCALTVGVLFALSLIYDRPDAPRRLA
ncbi:MAG: hypothetical protein EHM39_14365, partial [Chloroflexi bacterium]